MKKFTTLQKETLIEKSIENSDMAMNDKVREVLKGILLDFPDSIIFSLYRTSKKLQKLPLEV